MPSVKAPAKVLVTGASGFIAAWVVKDLLDQGYAVRGTLRYIAKAKHFNDIFKTEVEKGQLEFVEIPDLSVTGAFDAAVVDVDAILHIASPATIKIDDPEGEFIFTKCTVSASLILHKEVIKPAVNGTLSILESARQHG
jgi:nucleoside-diphosphate-sugar epimerase